MSGWYLPHRIAPPLSLTSLDAWEVELIALSPIIDGVKSLVKMLDIHYSFILSHRYLDVPGVIASEEVVEISPDTVIHYSVVP